MKAPWQKNKAVWHVVKYLRFGLMLSLAGLITASCTQKSKEEAVLDIGEIPICGTVQFSEGCSDPLDSLISYGLALVHHMTYQEAEGVFDSVIEADPGCFWGHWGKALTFIHPLWPDEPSEEQLEMGWALSQKALQLAAKEKEQMYGQALASYYRDGINRTEKERLKSYEQAWEKAYREAPEDLEIKTFYALSMISTADVGDKSYKNQRQAGALVEEVLQEIPDHPGGFHYAIHAYDYPALSNKAIAVANNYGKIAPDIPHALHMPTHIFTRQGMWKASIEWNKRSAEAALKNPANGAVSMHYFHALDYLVYAYLQRQEDYKAQQILEHTKNLQAPYQAHFATAYSLAAMEGRYLLERQAWDQAANLKDGVPSDFPWKQFPETQALTHFAKGLGGARSGLTDVAEGAIQKLDTLQSMIANTYWVGQIEIQKNAVKAWLAHAHGDQKRALAYMQLAADQESGTEKHAVTPGELLPAVELFGDLLMEMNRPQEAIIQYEAALQRSPGRFNSLYGAAWAAELSGHKEKAKSYYEQVVNLSAEAEVTTERRQKALAYLEKL